MWGSYDGLAVTSSDNYYVIFTSHGEEGERTIHGVYAIPNKLKNKPQIVEQIQDGTFTDRKGFNKWVEGLRLDSNGNYVRLGDATDGRGVTGGDNQLDNQTQPNEERGNVLPNGVNQEDKGQRIEFQRADGVTYGWYENGTIHLVEGRLNPNTMLHEHTHMLSAIMREINPDGWADVVRVCKEAESLWNEVANDPNYSGLKTDDEIASEVIARYSGSRGAQKMKEAYKSFMEENAGEPISSTARKASVFAKVRNALAKFWNWVATDLFKAKKFRNIDEVADMMLSEMPIGAASGACLPKPSRMNSAKSARGNGSPAIRASAA